ncbi:MAG TPA: DNA methyltransferase, partial [Methanoregulaceae archaeon]|nr:DNA methyltransferase [Methanoregulaceae archaeon]
APASPPAQEPACPPSPAPATGCTETCTELPPAIPTKSRQTKAAPSENPDKKKRTGRKKAEPEDSICEACHARLFGPPAEHACAFCREEQQQRGRHGWISKLALETLHLGDMEILGEQIPDESVDLIYTDPPYLAELWENAYARLAELASRVLKPSGFLFTYAPHHHLKDIMDILECSGDGLNYFWIMASLNDGQTAKDHKRNVLCLYKPILVFQKPPEKGAGQCFADVIKGRRQKAFHPWQQSIHDVLGVLKRLCREGDIVLDPYAGTGTTLKAANLLGLHWIGCEIDPKTHAIAVRELGQQAVDVFTFLGDEAPAPAQAREPVQERKDTTMQAAIEDPAKEARPARLPKACRECEGVNLCRGHDPYVGCHVAVNEEILKETRDHGTGGGPQPVQEGSCGTCGHHKGRKTFHDSCPRLGELLFKGGTKSAKVLMEETAREKCEQWIRKDDGEAEAPVCKDCSHRAECQHHDPESRFCLIYHPEIRRCMNCGSLDICKFDNQPHDGCQGESKPEKKRSASRKSKKKEES